LVKLLTLRLDVRSEVGKGSVFSLILPAGKGCLAAARTEFRETPFSRAQQTGNARLLLVEDNASVRRATSMLLELDGYHVTSVASLAEALQHVREDNRVDLLVSDYHLGDGETGTQVIAALREELGTSLPSVLTTGDTSSAIKHLPVDPRLRITSKPIQAEELLALLRELLASAS
jgi:CheY-like chemotaxis protein